MEVISLSFCDPGKLHCCADGPFKLYGEDAEYGAIAAEVEQQTGVITHGLFVGVATAAALITADGVDMFEPATSMQ